MLTITNLLPKDAIVVVEALTTAAIGSRAPMAAFVFRQARLRRDLNRVNDVHGSSAAPILDGAGRIAKGDAGDPSEKRRCRCCP